MNFILDLITEPNHSMLALQITHAKFWRYAIERRNMRKYRFITHTLLVLFAVAGSSAYGYLKKSTQNGYYYKTFLMETEPSLEILVKIYPVPTRAKLKKKLSGIVNIQASITNEGKVSAAAIQSGTGNNILDDEVLFAVKKSMYLTKASKKVDDVKFKVSFEIIDGKYLWTNSGTAIFAVCVLFTECKDYSVK